MCTSKVVQARAFDYVCRVCLQPLPILPTNGAHHSIRRSSHCGSRNRWVLLVRPKSGSRSSAHRKVRTCGLASSSSTSTPKLATPMRRKQMVSRRSGRLGQATSQSSWHGRPEARGNDTTVPLDHGRHWCHIMRQQLSKPRCCCSRLARSGAASNACQGSAQVVQPLGKRANNLTHALCCRTGRHSRAASRMGLPTPSSRYSSSSLGSAAAGSLAALVAMPCRRSIRSAGHTRLPKSRLSGGRHWPARNSTAEACGAAGTHAFEGQWSSSLALPACVAAPLDALVPMPPPWRCSLKGSAPAVKARGCSLDCCCCCCCRWHSSSPLPAGSVLTGADATGLGSAK